MMTSRDLVERVQARLGRALTPATRRALERVHAALREAVNDPRVLNAIIGGRVDEAVDLVFGSERVRIAREAIRAELGEALAIAGKSWSRVVVAPTLGVKIAYPALNQASMAALGRLDLQFFPPIFEETRAAFTHAIRTGLEAGKNPVDVARGLREFVGLTEYDSHIITTFELQLRGDPRAALGRQLRDRRFDGTVRRALAGTERLTEAQIATMRDAYARRLVKWRAETWSRTAAINATREANLAAWTNAADALGIDRGGVEKGWSTTMDGKERPEHAEADGLWVPVDDVFPVDGGVMTPGDGVWNCRCVMLFRLARGVQPARAAA